MKSIVVLLLEYIQVEEFLLETYSEHEEKEKQVEGNIRTSLNYQPKDLKHIKEENMVLHTQCKSKALQSRMI